MVPLKLFAKRCILLSSTTTQGIIAPFNADVSSSLSSSPGVINGDDDNDNDNYDSKRKKTYLRWKDMCSKTCWPSDYGIVSRYRSSYSYISSHVKRSYSAGPMKVMVMTRRRTFSTIGNAHTVIF